MWCFVTDSSGHWFRIPVSYKAEFERYVEIMENDGIWDGSDFDRYRSMHPVNYMYANIEVLKESGNSLETSAPLPIADFPINKPKLKQIPKDKRKCHGI